MVINFTDSLSNSRLTGNELFSFFLEFLPRYFLWNLDLCQNTKTLIVLLFFKSNK